MTIKNHTDQKNPSLEALISHAGNELSVRDENVGALEERVEVLPQLDGPSLADAKKDLENLLGRFTEARRTGHPVFHDYFQKENEPRVLLEDDLAGRFPDDDEVVLTDEICLRVLGDLAEAHCEGYDDNTFAHTNARPFGPA